MRRTSQDQSATKAAAQTAAISHAIHGVVSHRPPFSSFQHGQFTSFFRRQEAASLKCIFFRHEMSEHDFSNRPSLW